MPSPGHEHRHFADWLQDLLDADDASPLLIADMADVSRTTVYRWLDGTSEPSWSSVRRILMSDELLPTQRDALLQVLLRGTGYGTPRGPVTDAELDANGDGAVDAEDVIEALIELDEDDASVLRKALKELRDGRLTAEQRRELSRGFQTLKRLTEIAADALERVPSRQAAREARSVRPADYGRGGAA